MKSASIETLDDGSVRSSPSLPRPKQKQKQTILLSPAIRIGASLLLLAISISIDRVHSFSGASTQHISFPVGSSAHTACNSRTTTQLCASSFLGRGSDANNNNNNNQNERDVLNEIRERQLRDAVLEDALLSEGSRSARIDSPSAFLSLSLVGQGKLPLAASIANNNNEGEKRKANPRSVRTNSFASVLVLAPDNISTTESLQEPTPALFVPLTPPIDSRLQLLCKVCEAKPVSSLTSLILWNLNLINRDNNSLFDNIPWSDWTRDPDLKNRDAAGNLVDEKSRYGKRDAYNRFLGKDANTKTVTESQRRYWEKKLVVSLGEDSREAPTAGGVGDDQRSDENENDDDNDAAFSLSFLSKRVLELRMRELRMEIAEVDSRLAIVRNNHGNDSDLEELEETRTELEETLAAAETNLNELLSSMSSSSSSSPMSSSPGASTDRDDENLFDKIARFAVGLGTSFRTEQREAPYRGATGYAPRLSNDKDDSDVDFYRSPYDLLIEILSDQLNAEVIGCALENTSWLGGTLALGGAVVLRRRTPVVETTLMGETLQTLDRDQDFGNDVKGGEVWVVECDPDEAIGLALSSDLPIQVERTIFERSSIVGVPVQPTEGSKDQNWMIGGNRNIKEVLPFWRATDSGMSLHVEGDGTNRNAERLSPISIPRTTSSLFDSVFEPRSNEDEDKDKATSSSMFPTDNPIKSIDQWDNLTNEDKAKTLLEISNFSGRLPRPRTARKASPDDNPLDKLLLPLVDRSVRNEYKIREAERQGDLDLVSELRANKSELQQARERVDAARREGNEDLAKKWDDEAAFLETLKADVTQDDGAYSRFLDRDDWYERDRQKTAARVKKSSFGNLLDGIE